MKRLFAAVVLLTILVSISWAVNGEIIEVKNVKVLRVWGTPYERGFAQGYLLGEEIMAIGHDYLVPNVQYDFPVDPDLLRLFAFLYFDVPPDIEEEIHGLVAGMVARGVNIYLEEFGRDVDYLDFVVANYVADSTVDFESKPRCSSLSAWGPATQDSEFGGALAIERDMDWGTEAGDPYVLPANTIVLVEFPDEPAKQPVASVTFPGMLSCLSCFNSKGVGAFLNMGNCYLSFNDLDFSRKFHAAGIAILEALQFKDFDGDRKSTIWDVVTSLEQSNLMGSYDIHVVEPYTGQQSPAVIVEARNDGVVVRTPGYDPDFGDNILAATNSHLILCPFDNCWRYNLLKSMVQNYNYEMNFDRLVELSREVAMIWPPDNVTYHTMIYRPDTKDFWVSYTIDGDHIAPFQELVYLDPEILFSPPPLNDDDADDDGLSDDDTSADDDSTGADDSGESSQEGCGC